MLISNFLFVQISVIFNILLVFSVYRYWSCSVVEHRFAKDALSISDCWILERLILHNIVDVRNDVLLNLSGVEVLPLIATSIGVMNGLLGILSGALVCTGVRRCFCGTSSLSWVWILLVLETDGLLVEQLLNDNISFVLSALLDELIGLEDLLAHLLIRLVHLDV